jgi:gliding motility-associated-like protein
MVGYGFAWPILFLFTICFCIESSAQVCPPNLDFESGTFDRWTCYTGTTADVNGSNDIQLSQSGPVSGRHTVFTRSASTALDPYGNFPVVCPNGSGHSIRLGNDLAGTEAEGISYEFTIPANRNEYSLIYHYAVVFQDPNHLHQQQPRMVTEITNVTDNTLISCSSFTFYPYGSPLPGFFISQNYSSNTPVWCKDWTAVSINLDGNAGKTIRLFFKTADCTFRRHFGYAYIDVNSECSGEFTGATFCPGDSAVQVVAPHGYQSYTWYNAGFSEVMGKNQTLTLAPAPAAGTTLAVEVKPYFGYGCPDTLYAKLVNTFSVKAIAGDDKSTCFGNPEQIGSPPKPGVQYNWSPSAGLTNASIANPFANPQTKMNYVLTSRSYGGGCVDRDSVTVTPVVLDNSLRFLGSEIFCKGSGDSAVLQLAGVERIQWYKDEAPIAGANGISYHVNESGLYHAQLSEEGCTATTETKKITIEVPKPGIAYPIQYALINHPVTLQARTFGQTILWQPATYLNAATSATPVFNGSSDQSYTIQINTAAGCVTVDSQVVKIVKAVDILVPSAFTPNGDGRNDVLRPVLFGIKELLSFRVYNRWGQLMYETQTALQGWNGRFKGKMMGSEVVVWIAEGIGVDGKQYVRKGTSVCIQ